MWTSDVNPTPNRDWVPASCTLPTVEQPTRISDFDDPFGAAVQAVRRETSCCSFFGFDFTPDDDGVVAMTVTVPPAQTAVLDAFADRHPRTSDEPRGPTGRSRGDVPT